MADGIDLRIATVDGALGAHIRVSVRVDSGRASCVDLMVFGTSSRRDPVLIPAVDLDRLIAALREAQDAMREREATSYRTAPEPGVARLLRLVKGERHG